MANPETLRCFIALPLPEVVLDVCEHAADALRNVLPKAKWSRREGIHLTLVFLGSVERSQLPALTNALENAVAGVGPIRLGTNGIETFGRRGRPRVLWLDIDGDLDALLTLQARIEDACVTLGYESEEREFRPHLTLGRNKNANNGPPLSKDWLANVPEPAKVEWTASEVVLFESVLKPTGAEYTVLSTHLLAS